MSATEELRRLLRERGVECHVTVDTSTCRIRKGATAWLTGYNGYITEWNWDCGDTR